MQRTARRKAAVGSAWRSNRWVGDRHTFTTMPCVSATTIPSITMNATHPATSLVVSCHRPAWVCGGRKNSAGRFVMLNSLGSGNVGTVGAGNRAHHDERDDEEHEEADLEDDEPGAKSHEFEPPAGNAHLVVEMGFE